MARYLFLHPNLPGQYKHLAPALAAKPGNEVVFLTEDTVQRTLPGVRKITYPLDRQAPKAPHPYAEVFTTAVQTSHEVAKVCYTLRKEGFVPDAIVGHLGWGQGLYIKDVFPEAPILGFNEYYYGHESGSSNFLPNETLDVGASAKLRSRNASILMSMADADWAVSPTIFQFRQHPEAFWSRTSLLHDGVDVDLARPGPPRALTLPNGGPTLQPDHEVVTYISRNFEPYRGFPTVMRAASMLQKERPNVHVIFVGQDGVSYSRRPPDGITYRQIMEAEVDLDPERTHWLGYLKYNEMIRVMQQSHAHIYLSVPFVLSWSMLEAMATGCVVIGSNTAPVLEVLEDGVNGLTCDFFSPEDVVAKTIHALENREDMMELRRAARRTIVQRYALDLVLPYHIGLVEDLAAGMRTPPTADKIRAFNALHDQDPVNPPPRMDVRPTPPEDFGDYVDIEIVRQLKEDYDRQGGSSTPDAPESDVIGAE